MIEIQHHHENQPHPVSLYGEKEEIQNQNQNRNYNQNNRIDNLVQNTENFVNYNMNGINPNTAELSIPVSCSPDYSSIFPTYKLYNVKSIGDCLNAERFVPEHKRLQWDKVPDTLIMIGNSIRLENQALQNWIHNPSLRRSSIDFSFMNMLQFIPYFAEMFRNSKIKNISFWIHTPLVPDLMPQIQFVQKQLMNNHALMRQLTSKFEMFADMDHPCFFNMEAIYKAFNDSGGKYNENRIIRTTAETVARFCDEIYEMKELTNKEQNLHTMICRDYVTRTRMLVDVERDSTLQDMKAYDIYSHKFEYIEIPPPSRINPHCLACKMKQTGIIPFTPGSDKKFCAYHYNLSMHDEYKFKGLKSFWNLENRTGKQRASIIKCPNQYENVYETLKRMKYDNKLVGHLIIPGVAENRPLVSIGDLLRLRFNGTTTEVICEVAEVEIKTERVLVFLPNHEQMDPYLEALLFTRNMVLPSNTKHFNDPHRGRFDIRFGLFQTRGYELYHNLINNLSNENALPIKLLRTIVPTHQLDKNVVRKSACRLHIGISDWCNKMLNAEQKNAVFDIVRKNHGVFPYLINGPAGTGKTTTVLESIVQVLRHDESSKILVCAPSDTACDVIAFRLQRLLPTKCNGQALKMLRVNWWSRNPASLPPDLLSCSPSEASSGLFTLPSMNEMLDANIIICQCFVAGCLEVGSNMNWMERHFSHVFIDESSQSFEYESLIPLLKVGPHCSIILAGDPKQLGPTVRSITASRNGFALSLQERLMGLPLYKKYRHCVCTELRDNYRSHEVLLQVSSELFYNGNLRCKAPKALTSTCEKFELLPHSDFPLLVYDVEGEELNKLDTPSFFNVEECRAISRLITALLTSPSVNITTAQISVITCFRAQVLKLRQILRENNLSAIKVGVVEDFQGQETSVVLISTVLTKEQDRWKTGAKGGLGFMTDPKKFNVSITRASSLCVIVGYVKFLENSGTYWTALIEHAKRNNGITGENYSNNNEFDDPYEDDFGISYFLDRLRDMKLLGVGHEVDRYEFAMQGYYQDSPEWKVCL